MANQETASRKPLVDGMAEIPTTSATFLHTWLEIMRPFHHLTSREIDFASAMLEKRYEIAASVKDPQMIDKILFDEGTKEELRNKIGLTKTHMQVIMHKMRESGVIEGKRFNKSYIPSWTPGKPFRMVFIFRNKDDAK